jgi:hypothetical protein
MLEFSISAHKEGLFPIYKRGSQSMDSLCGCCQVKCLDHSLSNSGGLSGGLEGRWQSQAGAALGLDVRMSEGLGQDREKVEAGNSEFICAL